MQAGVEPLNPLRTAVHSGRPIKRVLVAVDGSKSADSAMQIALQIAEKYSAELDLIHVSNVQPGDVSNQSADLAHKKENRVLDSADKSSNTRNPESDEILTVRRKIIESKGVKSRLFSIPSNESLAGEEIVKQCNTGEYDIVALGSRGLGRARSFFLGSVSKKVVTEVRNSVLISKSSIESIRRILLAYDGSDGSKNALRFTADIAKAFQSVVNVISVISEPMLTAEIDVRAAIDRLDQEMRYYGDQAKSTLNELGVKCEESKVVGSEKISAAISKEAEEGLYDIVAMGTRSWGRARTVLLGSVALGVLDSSKANVLVVK